MPLVPPSVMQPGLMSLAPNAYNNNAQQIAPPTNTNDILYKNYVKQQQQ